MSTTSSTAWSTLRSWSSKLGGKQLTWIDKTATEEQPKELSANRTARKRAKVKQPKDQSVKQAVKLQYNKTASITASKKPSRTFCITASKQVVEQLL